MFKNNITAILNNNLNPSKQRGKGSSHFIKDLPTEFTGRSANIKEELARLDKLYISCLNKKLALINEIEEVRRNNNINWMALLKLAFIEAPNKAVKVFRKINSDDNKIYELFKKLGE